MYRLKRINDNHMAGVLFGLCWMVYFTTYIGRLNYSSAMPAMIGEEILSASQAGFISMLYFFAYGIGQLLNGFLGDRVHPRKMIFTGLFVSGLVNLLMGSLSNFFLMSVCWCANGYLQAMVWPPIIRIFAEMMSEGRRVKACVNITSTMALGTLASYLLSAAMIFLLGWRFVFFAAAFLMCGVAVVFEVKFRKVEAYAQAYGESPAKSAEPQKSGSSAVPFSKVLLSSGLLLILVPVVVHGVLKDGVTSWVPTYISEVFGTTPALSILVTTVLPIINLGGAYAAQFMYNRYFKKKEIKTAGFFFMLAVVSLFLLWRFSAVSMILTVMLLALITASMMAVNTLFVNIIPLHFEESGRVSTVSGFLNSMAYIGSAISTFTIGILVQHAGWNVTILSWLVITVAAMAGCFLLGNKRFESR